MLANNSESGEEYEVSQSGSLLDYRVTKILQPHEGFSVAIGFEKGILKEPEFLIQYGTLLIILLGALFLIPYYIYTWWKYGRDPESPSVMMIYETPNNLSPASVKVSF